MAKRAESLLLKLLIFLTAYHGRLAVGLQYVISGDGANAFAAEGYNGTSHVIIASQNLRADGINLPAKSASPTRIIGGYQIPISAAPWQVAIFVDGAFSCGGSIVARHWILTAAHCVSFGSKVLVRAGSSDLKAGGQLRSVELVVRHAKFRPNSMNHDVALFKVREPFHYNRYVQPVRLPKSNLKQRPRNYRVTGWGIQKVNDVRPPLKLRATDVVYVSKTRCRKQYSPLVISRYMFCAAAPGKDSCSGDSGGCMTSDGICFGIVSFGNGCADPKYPGVYTNVAFQIQWIKKVVGKF